MATDAFIEQAGRRRLGMWTLLEQLPLTDVTLTAGLADLGGAGWCRAVAAVARDASRRAEVALLEHHVSVVTGFVLGDDVGRQLVFLHQLRIPVTAATGLRDVRRIHVGLGRFDF